MSRTAGDIIRASDVAPVTFKRKSGTESVTSSVTPQDDDDFVLPLAVGTWRVEYYGAFSGSAGGDIRTQWTFSGTATISRMTFGPGGSTTDVTNGGFVRAAALSISSPAGYGTDGAANSGVHEDLLVEVTVAGTLTLQWAQNVSNATATIEGVSSRVYVTPLEVFS